MDTKVIPRGGITMTTVHKKTNEKSQGKPKRQAPKWFAVTKEDVRTVREASVAARGGFADFVIGGSLLYFLRK
jgi:hypothetical protein